MNTAHLSQAIVALQTAAYCGVFVWIWMSALGYAFLSLFCAFGLGTARYLLLDY